MDTDYTSLVILTYIMIIIGGVAGIGIIVAFLRKLGKIESKDKLEKAMYIFKMLASNND